LGFAFGFVIDFLFAAAGGSREPSPLISAVGGVALGALCSMLVLRMARRKIDRDFPIALVPREAAAVTHRL
jgi:hypothetical protein